MCAPRLVVDKVAIHVTDERPYVQAYFEEAMAWAVTHAAAVWCPMTSQNRSPHWCSTVQSFLSPSPDYQLSLRYLTRPWCFFECRSAMMRGVLWSRTPTAFTTTGMRAEMRRVGCLAGAALVGFLLTSLAEVYLLLKAAPSVECSIPYATLANVAGAYTEQLECGVAVVLLSFVMCQLLLIALACLASTGSELLDTLQMSTHITSTGESGFGSALMFDMGGKGSEVIEPAVG